MNPVTANDVLNYQGNAAAGLVGAGAFNVYGETDLRDANNAIFNTAYLNHQLNREIYRQKLSERDETLALLAANKLEANEVRPEDRPQLYDMINDIKQYALERHGDLKSNPNDWITINDKLAKFRDASAVAKSRAISYAEGMADAAKDTDPYRKQAKLRHWQNEMTSKDIYTPLDQFQQQLDYEPSIVQRKMEQVSKDLGPDKDQPFNRVKETRTDIANAYKDYVNEYQYGNLSGVGSQANGNHGAAIASHVDTFLENYFGQNGLLHPEEVQSRVGQLNQNLAEIAKQEGYDPRDENTLPNYLRPVKVMMDNKGNIHSAGNKWDDWFKTQLADQYRNSKASVYDKQLADQWNDKRKLDIDMIKAKGQAAKDYADARRANADAAGKEQDNAHTEDNFISDTKGAFDRAFKSATGKNVKNFTIGVDALSAQDKIGLGIKEGDEKSIKKITYDTDGTFYVDGRTITPSDYYRNSIKEYYSKKMKAADGTIDEDKLEVKIDQALSRGLKKHGLNDAEELNYINGGMKVTKITASDGKTYFRKGARIFDENNKDVTKLFE